MMQAARAQAEALHVKVSVAVCDAEGHRLACNRREGASAVSATVAQGQAAALAGFGRPSGALAADALVLQAIIAPWGALLPAQGAVPIGKNGALVGALGGSGALAHQDEEGAHAGGAALSTNLQEIWRLDSRNMPGRECVS
jgi:uncharacterized protein GlcG (DUF336 family)